MDWKLLARGYQQYSVHCSAVRHQQTDQAKVESPRVRMDHKWLHAMCSGSFPTISVTLTAFGYASISIPMTLSGGAFLCKTYEATTDAQIYLSIGHPAFGYFS
jgi:nitrate reductase NapE component